MEYQKIINFCQIIHQPNHTRWTRNWVEINDESRDNIKEIIKLELRLQCQSQVYVIIVIHIQLSVKL